ncbi:MAG TPA: M1 family aminopeptidase [Candidatus Polarisedimenticolaceae bacterium]
MALRVAAFFLSFTLAAAAEPPVLDAARAVVLENVAWKVGDATLRIEKAVAAPFASSDGPPLEVALYGRATLECAPREPVEAAYLEVFTGMREIRLDGDAAVLTTADPTLVERLLRDKPSTAAAEGLSGAEAFAKEWPASPEYRRLGIDLARWRSRAGDSGLAGFTAVVVRTGAFGRVYAALDPEDLEPFALGRFVPVPIGDHDADTLRRAIQRERHAGRYLEFNVADVGDWDSWVRSAPRDAAGEPARGAAGFDVERYELDVRIQKGGEFLRGLATVRLRWTAPARRTAKFSMLSDLKATAVRDGSGTPLPFVQVRGVLAVAFPAPSAPGTPAELSIDYQGAALEKGDGGYWWSRSTSGWYPSGGDSRSTYDVTLRWPERLDLVASGKRIDGGTDGDDLWERRVLETPGLAFSFEVGHFDVVREKYRDVDVTFAFGAAPDPVAKDRQKAVIETTLEALKAFESLFGDYPFPTLTVVTVPRGFSQGFPGFVSLAHGLFEEGGGWRVLGGIPYDPRKGMAIATIAHELSHQWWGNKVGWWSYRDQWLSEALANFSGTWFTYYRLNRDDEYLAGRGWMWRQGFDDLSDGGRPVGELGPVVLGDRLDSSLSDDAYRVTVYDKGALVFNTLVQEIGEADFLRMLHLLADRVNHRRIDTPTFFKAIERMSGLDLKPFVATFVEGTVYPQIAARHEIVPGQNGGWLARGEATVTGSSLAKAMLRRDAAGRWDVAILATAPPPLAVTRLTVPWRAGFGEKSEDVADGRVTLQVPSGTFEVAFDRKPTTFRLDPMGTVFADWKSESGSTAKAALVAQGMRATLGGRHEAAAELFRKGLAVPPGDGRDAADAARHVDGGAHVGLARAALGLGNDAEAREQLEQADKLLTGWLSNRFRDERDLLRARLEIRAGDAEAAYDRLARRLYLPFRQSAGETTVEQARRVKFSDGRVGTAESYAVLALAAKLTKRPEVSEMAAAEAAKRGADLSALEDAEPERGR